jgi:predicted ATPase
VDRPYVEQMRAVRCGCVRDVTLALTPLHALIGPNDSGKSTLLQALRAGAAGPWMWPIGGHVTLVVGSVARSSGPDKPIRFHARSVPYQAVNTDTTADTPEARAILERAISNVRLLRLDPDSMRSATNLIPHSSPVAFDERGLGLPAVYDAILSRDRDAFVQIERRFIELFPTVKSLVLENTTGQQKALGVLLLDKTKIFAASMSEGMLYWLAFAALPYLSPSPIVLVEEPENGLHPSRIAEVVRVLREVSTTTQVVLATHSPLVINELTADEVTIVTRTPEAGTIVTPMTQTKNFEQRSKIYALGELWLSYADGDLESELTGESTLPTKSAG